MMDRKNRIFLLIIGCLLQAQAYAIDTDLYLYFWPVAINNKVTIGGNQVNSTMNFSDILRYLNMEGNGAIKFSYNNWFLFDDFIYLDLGPKFTEQSAPGEPVKINSNVKTITNLLVLGKHWDGFIPFSVFVGGRYFYGSIEIDFPSGSLANNKWWITPVVGAGVNLPVFRDKLFFNLSANVGATNNTSCYEALPNLSYRFNKTCAILAGYRVLGMSYRKEANFKLNTVIYGPIVGINLSF